MEIIAERITVTTKRIAEAMKERDIAPILELAQTQHDQGCAYIDVSIGPATKDGPELMPWLVENIQKEIDSPLCLDTSNIAAMEAGLKVHKGKAIINSASGQTGRKEKMFELAAKYNSQIIALCMTDDGIPRDSNERCMVAFDLITTAQGLGIEAGDIYLDPLILPVSVQQEQAMQSVESIRMFKELSNPPTKSTVGLSNIYNGCPPETKPWIGGTFLALLVDAGLTTPITDPGDKELFEVYEKAKKIVAGESLDNGDGEKISKTLKILKAEDLFSASYLS